MSEENRETRSGRHKNRGGSSMIVKLAIGLVGLIAIIFLLEFFIGGPEENGNRDQLAGNNGGQDSSMIIQDSSEESSSAESEEESEENVSSEEESEPEKPEEDEGKTEIREIDSTDPNVIRAISGDWPPVGTEQGEPHVTNYNDGSADRIEIKRAASQATGVAEDDMIEHWVGNNGEQKVTATISQLSTGNIYKTYLSWIPGEGWQVTHYEELREMIQ